MTAEKRKYKHISYQHASVNCGIRTIAALHNAANAAVCFCRSILVWHVS